jgi:hypothetical protein
MEEFVLNGKGVADIIKSGEDLSACGVEGTSHRIRRGAGAEGIKFMKSIIGACLQSGRVIDTWKVAKTMLLHNNGYREQIEN